MSFVVFFLNEETRRGSSVPCIDERGVRVLARKKAKCRLSRQQKLRSLTLNWLVIARAQPRNAA